MTKLRTKDVRCIHRHTFEEHPKCFAEGNVKFNFETDREWERITRTPWYLYPEHNFCYFDIEADGLKPDWATMLSWAIKAKEGDTTFGVITKRDLNREINVDKRLVAACIAELRRYKIWVTYYGTGFDIPFLRAKAVHYDLDFPRYGEFYHHDLYYTIRNKFHLSRNSLDNATQFFGIPGKTPIDKEDWRAAKYGNKKALAQVIEHNIADVEILEALHDKIMPFRKWIRTSI